MKLVPKRRFKGFSGEWEEHALEKIMAEFIVPMRDKPKEFGGNIPWTRIEDIEGRYLHGTKSEQYVREETIRKMNLKIIPKDSLIVSASATFGVVAIVTSDLITNQTFIGLIPNDGYDLNFLYVFLKSPLIQMKMRSKSAGSTIFYISREKFEKLKGALPSLKEQEKIGKHFANLDNLIVVQKSKLKKLQAMKQAYLHEMFPAEGKSVPKRRFAGFMEGWATKKLGEILQVNSGRDYKHLQEGDIPVYGTGGYILSVDDSLSEVDGIGIGRKGTIDKPLYLKAPFWTVDTLFFLTPILSCDLYYFYLICQKVDWRAMDESTGVPSLSKNIIENIPLRVAKLEEQQKIGSFFKKLDERIAMQKAKVEKLKAMKKAYLEEMFV